MLLPAPTNLLPVLLLVPDTRIAAALLSLWHLAAASTPILLHHRHLADQIGNLPSLLHFDDADDMFPGGVLEYGDWPSLRQFRLQASLLFVPQAGWGSWPWSFGLV